MIDPWSTVAVLVARAELAPAEERAALLAEALITIDAANVPDVEREALRAELQRIAQEDHAA